MLLTNRVESIAPTAIKPAIHDNIAASGHLAGSAEALMTKRMIIMPAVRATKERMVEAALMMGDGSRPSGDKRVTRAMPVTRVVSTPNTRSDRRKAACASRATCAKA